MFNILGSINLGFIEFNATFFFQIFNTIVLIVIIYFIFKFFKKIYQWLSNKSALEKRVDNLEKKVNTELEKR